jgi:hypothetical protein
MGENLSTFGPWFKEDQIPYLIMRRFASQLVMALGFAHEHGVIHTGEFAFLLLLLLLGRLGVKKVPN